MAELNIGSNLHIKGGNLSVSKLNNPGGTVFDVQGSAGQLFSITDSLVGDLFGVNDISGMPIFTVNSNDLVTVSGDTLSTRFIKKDGTDLQFLKADGSVDENVYITGIENITDIPNRSYNDLQDLPAIFTQTESDNRYVNISGDTMTGDLNINTKLHVIGDTIIDGLSNISGIHDSHFGNTRVLNPKGGSLSTSISTGAIKISLPESIPNSMLRFNIDVYQYSAGKSFTLVVGGYAFNSTNWTQTSTYFISGGDVDFNVRFGHDENSFCVWIGETTTEWKYLSISVSNVQARASVSSDLYAEGWGISIVQSFDTVKSIESNNLIFGDYNKLKNIPADITNLNFVKKTGDTMTGPLTINQNADWNGLNIKGFDDQSGDYLNIHIGNSPMVRYRTNLSHNFYVDNSRILRVLSSGITTDGKNLADSFIKQGGLPTEFLKADGSVDSNTYALSSDLTSHNHDDRYVNLSGDTMTGDLNTTGRFISTGYSTSWGHTAGVNTGGLNTIMGTGSGATWLLSGTSGGTFRSGIQSLDNGTSTRFYTGDKYFEFNSIGRLSSDTFVKNGGTSSQFLKADGSVDSKTYITGISNITDIPNRSYNDLQDLPALYDQTQSDARYVNISGDTMSGDLTSTSFIKTGGVATEFLKADGSVDSSTYPAMVGNKIPEQYLPDSVLGQVEYQGTWNASTNIPALPSPTTVKGHYYVNNNEGTYLGVDYSNGDWVISNGTTWEKVDNSDAVTTVFGRMGNITAAVGDYDSFYPKLSSSYTNPSWVNSLHWNKITDTPTTLSGYGITDSFSQTQADGRYVNVTGDTMTGALSSTSFIKTGGTATEFLKADGSVDNKTYITGISNITAIPNRSYNDLQDLPTEFTPAPHNHDDRYFTEAEVTSKLGLKSDKTHKHTSIEVQDVRTLPENTSSSANFFPLPVDVGDRTLRADFGVSGTGSYKGIITVKGWTGNYSAWQIAGHAALGGSSAETYSVRTGSEEIWGPWRNLWHDGNLTDISQLNNDSNYITSSEVSDDYVKKSGDTMTGNLIVNSGPDSSINIYTPINSGHSTLFLGEQSRAYGGYIKYRSIENDIILGSQSTGDNSMVNAITWDRGSADIKVTGHTTSTAFIKTGGTATEFLKADGSVDSKTYITGISNITDIPNRSYNDLQDLPTEFTPAPHNHDDKYVNLTGDTMTGALSSTSFIKSGGTSSEFLKADGSVDDNAYPPLDPVTFKIPEQYLPDSVLGQVEYKGTWNATTNTPTLGLASESKGHYYVVNTEGTFETIAYNIGDWIISNGTSWEKVDNSESVIDVFGRKGNIVALEADYATFYPKLSSNYVNPSWITSLPWSKITTTPTTLSGYGITDAFGESDADGKYVKKTGDTMTGNLTLDGDSNSGSLVLRPNQIILNSSISYIDANKGGTIQFRTRDSSGDLISTVRLHTNGKVGINTVSPSEHLHVSGNILSDSFMKLGGTSSQFLKADGSVDSNTYLTTLPTHNHDSDYVRKIGDTMTGPLSINAPSGAGEDILLILEKNGGYGTTEISQYYGNNHFRNGKSLKFTLANITILELASNNMGTSSKLILNGDTLSNKFIKTGGVATEFLKADGSVDSNSYPAMVGNKIPEQYLPDSVLGQVEYMGTWNANTDTPTLPDPTTVKGHYYVNNNEGIHLGIDFSMGDWVISNGVSWEKVDNSDTVTTVFGRMGNITAESSDYDSFYPKLSSSYSNPSWVNSLHWNKITDTPTTLSGYGITDAFSQIQADGLYVKKSGDVITNTVSGEITESLLLKNDDVNAGTGSGIYGGFSTSNNYYHSGIEFERTNLGGGHASSTHLLARKNVNGTGKEYLDRLFTVGYNGSNPFTNSIGDITSPKFIKSGGTSSEFLKADGSVDETTYLPFLGVYGMSGESLDLLPTGAYALSPSSASSDKPLGISPGGLISISGAINGGAGTQILGSRDSSELVFRGFTGSTFYPWKKIWHDGNLTNISQLNNDANYISSSEVSDDYVKKSGDTMTGELIVPSFISNGNITQSGSSYSLGISHGSNIIATNHLLLKGMNSHISLQAPSNSILYKAGVGHIFSNNTDEQLRITPIGNVGISTDSPTEKLHVSGNILSDSFIKQGGLITQFLKADGSVDNNLYPPLNTSTNKIPEQYLPDSVLGQVEYMGTWNATTNTPSLPSPTTVKGHYYVVNVGGVHLTKDYNNGDWVISNGTTWEKVDNTDAVNSVFGREGDIVAKVTDYESFYPKLSSSYTNPSWVNSLHWNKITNTPTTLSGYGITDSFSQTQADGRYVNVTGDTMTGSLTSTSFIKSGGTATEFLKADGSVDNNTYALSSDTLNNFIPNSALGDYENITREEIDVIIQAYYQRVLDEGGTVESDVDPQTLLPIGVNAGIVIRDIQIINGVIEKIELDYLKVSDIPKLPTNKIIDYNTWEIAEW